MNTLTKPSNVTANQFAFISTIISYYNQLRTSEVSVEITYNIGIMTDVNAKGWYSTSEKEVLQFMRYWYLLRQKKTLR